MLRQLELEKFYQSQLKQLNKKEIIDQLNSLKKGRGEYPFLYDNIYRSLSTSDISNLIDIVKRSDNKFI